MRFAKPNIGLWKANKKHGRGTGRILRPVFAFCRFAIDNVNGSEYDINKFRNRYNSLVKYKIKLHASGIESAKGSDVCAGRS